MNFIEQEDSENVKKIVYFWDYPVVLPSHGFRVKLCAVFNQCLTLAFTLLRHSPI